MGSEPIPLPYRSWDEVPPDRLQTIVTMNSDSTNTGMAPPVKRSTGKTFMGIKYGTILIIILAFMRGIARYNRDTYPPPALILPDLSKNMVIPDTQSFEIPKWMTHLEREKVFTPNFPDYQISNRDLKNRILNNE